MALSAAEDQPGGLDHGRYAQAKAEMSDEFAHMSDDGVGAVRRAKAQRRASALRRRRAIGTLRS